jgi:integrase
MPTTRLTQLAVEKLAPPPIGRVVYWDRHLPGFGVRVTANGAKSWIAMYRVNGKAIMETIGPLARYPKVEDARQRARDSMAVAGAGENPVASRKAREQQTAVSTFRSVAERYVERYAKKQTKPATWKELQRQLAVDVFPKWGERRISSITRQDVADLLDVIEHRGSPVQANRTLARLKTLFAWAMREEVIDRDPTAHVDKVVKERARDRVLTDAELGLFWSACDDLGWPFGPMGKLLLLTAQRRDEVAGMEWSELDLANRLWLIPKERAKNDRANEVHLNDLAVEVIEALPRLGGAKGRYVFTTTGGTHVSGYSKGKAAIDRRMGEGVEPWVFHDLRRTAATGMARLNVPPHVVDRLLNHVSGEIRGVAAVYNRFQYLDERRAALEAWGRYIEALLGRQAQNVVSIASAR